MNQNCPKTVQNGPWGALGGPLGRPWGPRGVQWPKKDSKREAPGSLLAPFLSPDVTFLDQKRFKNEPPKRRKKQGRKRRLRAPFWIILGALLVAFWDQKWVRERPWTDFLRKNDLCVSCSKSYTKMKILASRREEKSILGGFGA